MINNKFKKKKWLENKKGRRLLLYNMMYEIKVLGINLSTKMQLLE